ncbi:hypothetical protein P389DRAFT_170489 [Cystobasidium minutum MCA 4210]|uniref:uncharacterized protein n=1 Tax=Cystobasidium minutum MCA 4210 TaxID=1397322 RepID=UPI0034CD7FA7|eukprot:jgi/Rhomi1/170489/fgenesh1_kg.4_\
MVYHTIVKKIAAQNFERVNVKDHEAILKGCTDNIKHRFGGDHALGGERNDKEHLRQWFQRLAICAPGLKLTVRNTWVKGGPWDTTIIIRWTATDTFPNGKPYNNHGVHIIKMAWFKVYDIDANEDSQVVDRMMKAQAEAGVKEAAMPPIVS